MLFEFAVKNVNGNGYHFVFFNYEDNINFLLFIKLPVSFAIEIKDLAFPISLFFRFCGFDRSQNIFYLFKIGTPLFRT